MDKTTTVMDKTTNGHISHLVRQSFNPLVVQSLVIQSLVVWSFVVPSQYLCPLSLLLSPPSVLLSTNLVSFLFLPFSFPFNPFSFPFNPFSFPHHYCLPSVLSPLLLRPFPFYLILFSFPLHPFSIPCPLIPSAYVTFIRLREYLKRTVQLRLHPCQRTCHSPIHISCCKSHLKKSIFKETVAPNLCLLWPR